MGELICQEPGRPELAILKSKILSGRYVFSACFRSAELHSAGLRKSLARPDCPQGPGCSADLQSAVSAELHSANLATTFGCLTATRSGREQQRPVREAREAGVERDVSPRDGNKIGHAGI